MNKKPKARLKIPLVNDEILPSFKKPPVNEVCIGLQFSDLPLELRHIEAIHTAFGKAKYPNISSNDIMAKMNQPTEMHLQFHFTRQLPRIWFEEKNEIGLIQIQTDRLHYNWRRNEAINNNYVRFPQVWNNFDRAYKGFCNAIEADLKVFPRPEMLELIYVNVIPYDEEEAESIGSIFVDFEWANRKHKFIKAPNHLQFSMRFPCINPKSYLQANIKQTFHQQTGQKGFYFELIAREANPENDLKQIKKWFSSAREAIVKTFAEMTTPKMHKIWERER